MHISAKITSNYSIYDLRDTTIDFEVDSHLKFSVKIQIVINKRTTESATINFNNDLYILYYYNYDTHDGKSTKLLSFDIFDLLGKDLIDKLSCIHKDQYLLDEIKQEIVDKYMIMNNIVSDLINMDQYSYEEFKQCNVEPQECLKIKDTYIYESIFYEQMHKNLSIKGFYLNIGKIDIDQNEICAYLTFVHEKMMQIIDGYKPIIRVKSSK